MIHQPARVPGTAVRRIAAPVAAAVAAATLLSACSAGQVAQTARDVAPIEGANVTRGGVAIRAAEIATPPGGSYAAGGVAPLYVVIVTDDGISDTLVDVRTPAAGSVAITSEPVAGAASPSSSSSPLSSPSSSPSSATPPAASASPSASAAASASPSASAGASATAIQRRLGPGSLTAFRAGGDYLQLRGLTRELTPGMTVPITFSFAQAGDITFDLPVATPGSPGPRPTPRPAGE